VDPLEQFIEQHMQVQGRVVPARLQAALALLERLRSCRSLNLSDHMAAGSSGLKGHETFGRAAHMRLQLDVVNRTHGRRSSHLQAWGQQLLEILQERGFVTVSEETAARLIDDLQAPFAARLRRILDSEPLVVRHSGRSPEAMIREILQQAEAKRKAGEVAQYLVAAKLELRLAIELPLHPANKADRQSRFDLGGRWGDFQIASTVIEVAMGLPDEKHISQILVALDQTDVEVRLLTRWDRVETWHRELGHDPPALRRVVVSAVDAFVGQNIAELGGFAADEALRQLRQLVERYNDRWIQALGTPELRIEIG
jgi:hypothetical protein